MKLSPSFAPLRTRRGFTLTEVMISTGVLSALMGIIMSFYIDSSKLAFISDQKNKINRDVRTLTAELSMYARQSNFFVLYRSFAAEDRNEVVDQLMEGNSGDFLLLVYQGDPPNVQFVNVRPTLRLVGYYRASAGEGLQPAPVRKFDVAIPTARQFDDLESLIPSASQSSQHPRVIELSEGLANHRLFYNLWGRSAMINGKVLHGNDAKRVTDTYNFTVSPRGQY